MASIQETLGAGRKGYATLVAADPPRRSTFRRIVLPTILATVLLGFAAIVWLAWQDDLAGSGEPPLVRAAPGPIKRPPDTPGGVDIEGERHGMASLLNGAPAQPRVERLLPREPPPPKSLAEADPGLLAPPPPPAPPPAASPAAVAPPPAPTGGLGAAAAAGPVPPSIEPTAPSPRTTTTSPSGPDLATVPAPPTAPSGSTTPAAAAEPAPPAATVRAMPTPASRAEPPAPAPAAAPPVPAAPPVVAALPSNPPAARPPVPSAAAQPTPAAPAPVATAPARPAPPAPERLAAREPPTAPAPPAAGRGGPWGVQIAAVSSREAAERGWMQLQSRHPEVLGPLQLRVDEARLANGLTLYRLQGLGFPDRESAAQACARLKAAGTECFVVGGR
ncbi:MAG: hypothetical protein KatS3mg117_2409 [Geminicoccaceae bacterium]|nr:MAG: hypothetical protein KatS3mg117_2409 [Geminicoccaceae bacterium]